MGENEANRNPDYDIFMVFCGCIRDENKRTAFDSGLGAAVGNTVTESAVSGGTAWEEYGSAPDSEMTVTREKKDGPMLSERVDQT